MGLGSLWFIKYYRWRLFSGIWPIATTSCGPAAAALVLVWGWKGTEAGSHDSPGWHGTQRDPHTSASPVLGLEGWATMLGQHKHLSKGRLLPYLLDEAHIRPWEVRDCGSVPVFCCITNNHKSFRLQQYIYIVWRFHGVQAQLPSLTGLLRISYDCNQGLFDAKVQFHAHVTMLTWLSAKLISWSCQTHGTLLCWDQLSQAHPG